MRRIVCQQSIRKWGIFGAPNAGKSTFLSVLRQPMLVIDADHRIQETVRDTGLDAIGIDDPAYDIHEPLDIHKWLRKNRCDILEERVKTVAVDSLTSIISPLNSATIEGNRRGINKNKVAGFADKANAMRLLQDSISAMGTDVMFIWHLESSRDAKNMLVNHPTLSETEQERLKRNLNAIIGLHVSPRSGARVAKITWSRSGAGIGVSIPDTEGGWRGVPEKIDALIDPSRSATSAHGANPTQDDGSSIQKSAQKEDSACA